MMLADGLLIGVYPTTPSLVDWMVNNLFPVESSAFFFWRERISLVNMALRAEAGLISIYAAYDALEQHRQETGETLTYDDCVSLSTDNVFSDAGEWVVYTDKPGRFILGEYTEASDALFNADDCIDWVLLWLPYDNELLVFRSPFQGRREAGDPGGYSDGMKRSGSAEMSYVLPDGIEGAILQDISEAPENGAFER